MNLTLRIWRDLLPGQRRRATSVLGLGLFGGLMELAGVGSVMPFLILLSRPELVRTQPILHRLFVLGAFQNERAFLIFCGAAAVIFLVSANATVFLRSAATTRFCTDQMPRIGVRMLRAYLEKDYPFFLERHSGQLAKDIMVQTDAVANNVLQSWLTAACESSTILLLTALILWADPRTGAIVLAGIGAIVGGSYLAIRQRVTTLGRLNDEASGRRFELCLEILGAAKEIKAARAETRFAHSFEPAAREHATTYRRSLILQALPPSLVQAVAASLLLGVAIEQLAAGSSPARVVALLSLYAVAGYRLLPSLLKFSGAVSQMRQFRSVFDNVIATAAAAPHLDVQVPQPLALERDVRFEDVAFRYPGQAAPVFDGLNLTVRRGEFVALAGGSGAGKSTLADLLLGLQRPGAGRILVDGRPLDDELLPRWRGTAAFVPQSVFLFDSSIAENIAFDAEPGQINMARARRAAELAQISDFIDGLPDGYRTRVGERGGRLSGGQRQRLGIARALYRDPALIILDEPTSALDGITETELAKAIGALKGRLTLVVIAHRPSTVRLGDRVVVLEKGRILDAGSYDDILRRTPHFAQLMSEAPTAAGPSGS